MHLARRIFRIFLNHAHRDLRRNRLAIGNHRNVNFRFPCAQTGYDQVGTAVEIRFNRCNVLILHGRGHIAHHDLLNIVISVHKTQRGGAACIHCDVLQCAKAQNFYVCISDYVDRNIDRRARLPVRRNGDMQRGRAAPQSRDGNRCAIV